MECLAALTKTSRNISKNSMDKSEKNERYEIVFYNTEKLESVYFIDIEMVRIFYLAWIEIVIILNNIIVDCKYIHNYFTI